MPLAIAVTFLIYSNFCSFFNSNINLDSNGHTYAYTSNSLPHKDHSASCIMHVVHQPLYIITCATPYPNICKYYKGLRALWLLHAIIPCLCLHACYTLDLTFWHFNPYILQHLFLHFTSHHLIKSGMFHGKIETALFPRCFSSWKGLQLGLTLANYIGQDYAP